MFYEARLLKVWFGLMVFIATSNNISVRSWRSVLLVDIRKRIQEDFYLHPDEYYTYVYCVCVFLFLFLFLFCHGSHPEQE